MGGTPSGLPISSYLLIRLTNSPALISSQEDRDLPVVPPLTNAPIIAGTWIHSGTCAVIRVGLRGTILPIQAVGLSLVSGQPPTPLGYHAVTSIPNFAKGQPFDGTGGLLPAIAQDAESGRVLMIAWMDSRAWAETLESGYAVYFSRSRRKLWRKGETSGHRQKVTEVRVDCDADAILLQVEQVGAACHEGFASCFFRRVHANGDVEVAESRLVDPESVYGNGVE